MATPDLVELADQYSRRRAVIAMVAAVAFLGVQWFALPRIFGPVAPRPGLAVDLWAVNALALLGVLATGGGLLNRRQVRALVQDELAQSHLRTAVLVGYWVAMGLAFLLYLGPWFRGYTGRQAIYVLVTGSVVVSLLTFAGLERRAHADG